jgi:hypothetical protein
MQLENTWAYLPPIQFLSFLFPFLFLFFLHFFLIHYRVIAMVHKDINSLELARESIDWPVDERHSIELVSTNESYQHINRMDEIELVHRLDKRLLLFAMFGNLVKTLDNTNLGTYQVT